jgi:hypothetical protein
LKFENFTQEISKFQNSKNGMHQVGPNCYCTQNFSSLSLKATEKRALQIFVNGGSGGGGNAA